MRTTQVSRIDGLLDQYLRDQLSLSIQSSASLLDKSVIGASADDRLVRCIEVSERWGWLFRYCDKEQMALLINDSMAKAFRRKSTRMQTRRGCVDVEAEGELTRMSEPELAKALGLSVYQYRRRLTKARAAISRAIDARTGHQARQSVGHNVGRQALQAQDQGQGRGAAQGALCQ